MLILIFSNIAPIWRRLLLKQCGAFTNQRKKTSMEIE